MQTPGTSRKRPHGPKNSRGEDLSDFIRFLVCSARSQDVSHVSDQSIFPEIELDKVKRTQGMDITFVTTAKTNDEAKDLLTKLGMPFAK